jgi:hypothetical protein
MVDNVVTNPGAGGAVFASDDIGGIQYPRVKNTYGDDGTAIDVSATNPMPVGLPAAQITALAPLATQPISAASLPLPALAATSTKQSDGTQKTQIVDGAGAVIASTSNALNTQLAGITFTLSASNSSTVQLAAGAPFTGVLEASFNQPAAQIMVICDQNYTVNFDQFDGANNLISTDTFTRLAGVATNENVQVNGDSCRVRVTNNGGSATTTLRIETTYGPLPPLPRASTNLGNLKTALNELNGTAVATGTGASNAGVLRVALTTDSGGALGPAAQSASSPVTLSNDLTVGAAASIAALNIDLLTGTASGWYDAANFHSVAIQIIGSAGITAGAITFEQTNDITNAAAGNVWAVEESTSAAPTPNIAAITIAASTIRMFGGAVTARYVRVRVSTAFATANVQAVAVFSQMPFMRMTQSVHNATSSAFQAAAFLQTGVLTADVASAALTTTTTTAAIAHSYGLSYEINVPVTVMTGTSPTLDIGIEESDDTGTNWFRVYDFPRIIATGMYRSPKLPMKGNRIRYVQTVNGTSPSFTRSLNRIVTMDATTAISQIIDRALITTQALNSTTGSVNTQNCRSAQMVINAAAMTTAPALQLEGSDDGGATWYAVGTPLTAVANSTVQVTIANMQSAFLRARVSTAGATATLGYILIKGF